MRLLYATSIVSSGRANRMQVFAMAKVFGKILGENFWLGSRDEKFKDTSFSSILFYNKKSWALTREYLKFARSKNADIFYCRENRILLWAILFNFFYHQNLIFIYEVHHLYENGIINLAIEKFLSFFVHKYIFVTRHLADMYQKKYGLKNAQIVVAPDGVDLEIFDINISKEDARKKLNLPQNKKIIGYCGRFKTMGEDKGFFDILESLKYLPETTIFVAMGGKPHHVLEFQKISEDMSVGNRVIFRGHEVQSTVTLYQKAFDLLLMPFPKTTHYSYYMSPMKMFEYMASKRPIVSSDLPSIREILNENNAVLTESENPKSLAEGIKNVLDNPEFAQKLANQAYEDVKQYTWEKRAEHIFKHLKI